MWERIRALMVENLNLKLLSFAFALVLESVGECRHQAEGQYGALLRGIHRRVSTWGSDP